MAILEQYLSKDQVGNRTFSLIKSVLTQFSTQGSVKNKNSKLIEKIINSVESNSSWLNIKRYRKNIEEIKIKMGNGIDQDKGECALITIHFNLREK